VTTTYGYDAAGELLTTTLDGYTGNPTNPIPAENLVQDSRSYDAAGRLASDTSVNGTTTDYFYYDNNQLAQSYVVCSTCSNGYEDLHTYSYDAAGNRITETAPGGLRVGTNYDADNQVTSQVTDPYGVDRTVRLGYDTDGSVTAESLTGGGVTQTQTMTYNAMDQMLSQSLALPGAGGPAGWWELNQSSGTTVTDSTGNGHTGTATGVTWSGGAASFTGTTGQQLATSGPVLDTDGSFTVAAWVNMAGNTTSTQTVAAQAAGTNSGFYLKYDSGLGEWTFTRPSTDTTNPSWPVGSHAATAASTGTWTFLTGTYNVNTGTLQLYVNGSSSGTTTGSDSTPFASQGPLLIGRSKFNGNAADLFDGQITDVQVYQRALSANEVSTLYGLGRGGGDVTTGKLTTTYQRDQRGLVTAETDPAGNTTSPNTPMTRTVTRSRSPSRPTRRPSPAPGR
jgi:YD repeat-containing protein